MDTKDKKHFPSEYESAGLISKLLFLWIIPLFRLGNKKDIELADINNVPSDNKSEFLTKNLEKQWNLQCIKGKENGTRPKFLTALLKSFGTRYAIFVLIFIFDTCVIRIAQPIFLKFYIRSFSQNDIHFLWQFFYAGGICLTILFHILLTHPTNFQFFISGMRCRVAASSLIYRKTLRLSKSGQGQSTVGQIVNLLTNDVSRFDYNLFLIAFIFAGPIQICLFFYILWVELGLASIVGVGYVLLLSPSQYIIGKLSAKFRMQIAEKTDERSRIMNEIILGIRLIKMYAWEKPFSGLIQKIRELEFKSLKKRSLMRSSYMGVYTSNFTFVPFLAILAYGLLGNEVTPDKAFFAVAIFNAMTEVMMYFAPNACACIGELLTSVKRIEDFLLMEEQQINEDTLVTKPNSSESATIIQSVQLNGVSASWDSSNKPTLADLSLDVKGDMLVMIIGPVGSGKSSLLQLLIGELPITRGICKQDGVITYSSQESWIFTGSIRQNILFGQEYHEARYNEIIEVCALAEDLVQFPFGDMSIVGERGVSLSGGQKARINLARSLYHQADIYLLDDPLSAVDSAVSRHIFEKCLNKYLKGYLRILVTHQLQYLPQSDHIIVLDQGVIAAQGSYSKLMEDGIDFVSLLASQTEKKSEDQNENSAGNKDMVGKTDSEECTDAMTITTAKTCHEKQDTEDEEVVKGAVSAATYWNYFRAGDSLITMSLLAFGFILNQTLITSTDYWLSLWTNFEEEKVRFRANLTSDTESTDIDSNELTKPFQDPKSGWNQNIYMTVYICLAVSVFIVDTVRAICLFMYTMRISNNIHNKMFSSLVNAPVKFFDTNPSGRIINRFTKDMGALDEYLPLTVFDTLDIGFRMIGILLIVITSNYFIVLPVLVLISAYTYLRQFYVRTARNIKRIEAVTRSPLYTHVSSSVHGLTTIRSSKSQKLLISQFDDMQDVHSATWYHFNGCNSWFSMWLELTSTFFIIIVTYGFLGVSNSTTSGVVGVTMACLFQLMNIFYFGMRQSAETENLMTSVERTLEYTKLTPESDVTSNKIDKSLKDWPSRGLIKFHEVRLSYDERNDVLKNVSFEIQPNEKIGIVGRTGAGKSSILSALFRLSEISGGDISIDGVKTTEIPLKLLRSAISIIPQDPVLFSGSIRYNLDPLNKFSDEQLWQVLEEVELKGLITALDFKVYEEGSNFSVGQRQLVCLARAILRNNKILVLDEATANVDPRTDNLIQQTIRKKFCDCTIVTIAHRLQSVIDCDRILVLSGGNVMEYDHPYILLQNPEGYFSKMLNQTGNSSDTYLRELAFESYKNRSNNPKNEEREIN